MFMNEKTQDVFKLAYRSSTPPIKVLEDLIIKMDKLIVKFR